MDARETSTVTATGSLPPSSLDAARSAAGTALPGSSTGPEPLGADEFAEAAQRILASVRTVIDGKDEAGTLMLTALLAEGHVLLEDVPGVGKTMLAKALARTVDCAVTRLQFTPDLLPSDITGVSIYNQDSHRFEFRRGPVFANIVIGDEINRASAKTQSALLECMEERQVTVDGTTWALADPFMVVATQNPVEMEGTYPLPEAQRDRFMLRLSMGYPDARAEADMLGHHQSSAPLEQVRPVVGLTQIAAMTALVRDVYVSGPVKEYAVALGRATREHPSLRLGVSPRGLLQLVRAAKARAALAGRDFVLPDDISSLIEPVLAHRLLLDRRAAAAGETTSDILIELRSRVAVPRPAPAEPRRR